MQFMRHLDYLTNKNFFVVFPTDKLDSLFYNFNTHENVVTSD